MNPEDKLEADRVGVSVVVCCYNSAMRLPETLRQLARQKVPASIPWEVILVNNASTDDTVAVAAAEWRKNGSPAALHLVDEPVPGQAQARQRGIACASYRIVVFVDDDNWLDQNYLKLACEIMSEHTQIGVLGGCIAAQFEAPPPPWFGHVQAAYAVGPQGQESGDITNYKPTVAGAGMVLRKSAYRQLQANHFKFRVRGNSGSRLVGGDDQEICFALVLSGYRTWYDDRLRLTHFIPRSRLTRNYYLSLVRATEAGALLACYKAAWRGMDNSPLRFYLANLSQRSRWLLRSAAKFVLGRQPMVLFQAQWIFWRRSLLCLPALRRSFKQHYLEISRLKDGSTAK